jgi:imidazolonepropionase-like amidohydrolase
LRAAGTTVLYGTDLGNTQLAAISGEEIDLLLEAGLDGQAIVTAMTTAPARYWGLDQATPPGPGVLRVDGVASFMIVAADPRLTPTTLAEPEAVFVAGVRR